MTSAKNFVARDAGADWDKLGGTEEFSDGFCTEHRRRFPIDDWATELRRIRAKPGKAVMVIGLMAALKDSLGLGGSDDGNG